MDSVLIRRGEPADAVEFAAMRKALWPDLTLDEHTREATILLTDNAARPYRAVVFLADADGRTVGFIEADLRSHADGCDPAQPVGYVEGWYVAEGHRHRGVGRQLLAAAEDWARGHGCVEMASDTWI